MLGNGRNLATNSKALDVLPSRLTMNVGKYNGNESLVQREDGFAEVVANGTWHGISVYANKTEPQVGETFTFSANARNDAETAQTVSIYMMCFNSAGSRKYPPLSTAWVGGNSLDAGEERRIAFTATWSQEAVDLLSSGGTIRYTIQRSNSQPMAFWAPKLERGTEPTEYRQAPEDLPDPSDYVIATDTCTLAVTVDVESVETFYYQTASTASAPAKPTTATPSGWQTTEFAFDATKAVWTCQKTTLTDGTFRWGEVSKWSAYEGAVVSKNAADAAQSTANSANAREQRIYRSAASGTASMAATETWVTSTADAQNAWTAKRPSYDRSYPVLFTATQRQTVAQQAAGSTCTCTTPYVDESAAVAGNYIVSTASNDVWIHSEDHGPDANGNATANTYGWRIGSVFELVRAGLSYLKMWVDNSVAKVRVGLESAGHAVFSPSGMDVFDYDTTAQDAVSVAEFGKGGARIGKPYVSGAADNESHMELDYHSMKMVDKDGNTYLYVSDLRGTDGVAEIVDQFVGDGTTTTFNLSLTATDTDYTVSVSDSSGGTVTPTTTSVSFQSAPTSHAIITVTYSSVSSLAKAYTLGLRDFSDNIGAYSFVEGYQNMASGYSSHAEGHSTIANGYCSHAEGRLTTASGYSSHAEGSSTASGYCSHAEGLNTEASGYSSHAEGDLTTASDFCSHAEGDETTASGYCSHAEGSSTIASGYSSHAQNYETVAASSYQTALGKYNVEDANDDYAVIIGNGTSGSARSNALAVRWDGTCDVGNVQSVSGDNHAYPLFIWTSSMANPESYSGTYPVSPCFVYYVPNNGLYYCEN